MYTMTTATRTRSDLAIVTMAPNEISSILLADGWHTVRDCQFTQFAVSPAASPPQPNKLYSALQYRDLSNDKVVVTPLSQILGFEAK
jgi:hypothetical protein